MGANVVWEPESERPADASLLAARIEEDVPGVQVKLTRVGDIWRVRALAPAAFCARGGDFSGRDVSRRVVDWLGEHGVTAEPHPRKTKTGKASVEQ